MSSWVNHQILGEVLDLHVLLDADFNSDQTSTRFDCSLYDRVGLLVQCPSGSAGDDVSIKTLQADAFTSGNTKAITFDKVWYKINNADQWSLLELTTATNDLDTGATGETTSDLAGDESRAEFFVEFKNEDFDGNSGYKYLEYQNEGDDLSNARVCKVIAVAVGPKYMVDIPLDPTT